ncbi:hypothetical protein MY11210_008301 [Beauveria gryllotalpidicola]
MATLGNSRCLFNSRAALQRVFSLSQPTVGAAGAAGHVLRSPAAHHQARAYAVPPSRRGGPRGQHLADSADRVDDGLPYSPLYTTAAALQRSQKDRMPQDFEITDPKIMVLENGSVAGPLATKYVLSKLDAKTESLRMIRPYVPKGSPLSRRGGKAPAPAEDGEAPAPTTQEEQFALCEIVNKKEAFQKEQERKQLKKENAKPKTKEMELTWAISEHDLQTKLRQLAGFLSKGMKVQLVLGTKRGGRKVDEGTAKALMNKIRDEVQALGAREVTSANGDLGRTMRMNFEGVVKKQT